jgi:hypothetical protein
MKLFKLEVSERLCKDVGDHFICRAVGNRKNVVINNFTNEVEAGVDMLCTHVESRVLGEDYCTLIIAE